MGKTLLTTLIFLAILLIPTTSLAYADKGTIPIDNIPIYEPSQKAIVAWNGEEEILILSVDLKTLKAKTPVLEVLPLPSIPEIEEASPKSFEVLQKYFMSKKLSYGERKGLVGVEGVEIVFHEKIGFHDVTVVKVKDVKDFVYWIKDFTSKNGLPTPNLIKVLTLVEDYIKRGFNYFVLDLVEVVQDVRTVKPLMYRFESKKAYFPLKISSLAEGKTTITVFLLTKEKIMFPRAFLTSGYRILMENEKIPIETVAEADQRLVNLFKPNINVWFSVITYIGRLQSLREDLLLEVSHEKWIPYKPNPEQVKISVEKTDKDKTLIKVSITFKSGGFRVDWGQVERKNSVFSVDTKVEAWTGPAIQVITVETATYNLGSLQPGDYTFIFNVNGQYVKSVEFKVEEAQQGQPLALPDTLLNLIIVASFIGLICVLAFGRRI